MKEFKREYLPILYKIRLSKDMYFKTQVKRDEMKMIPYTLHAGSIIYEMLCTRSDVSYALSIMSIY